MNQRGQIAAQNLRQRQFDSAVTLEAWRLARLKCFRRPAGLNFALRFGAWLQTDKVSGCHNDFQSPGLALLEMKEPTVKRIPSETPRPMLKADVFQLKAAAGLRHAMIEPANSVGKSLAAIWMCMAIRRRQDSCVAAIQGVFTTGELTARTTSPTDALWGRWPRASCRQQSELVRLSSRQFSRGP